MGPWERARRGRQGKGVGAQGKARTPINWACSLTEGKEGKEGKEGRGEGAQGKVRTPSPPINWACSSGQVGQAAAKE